MQKKIGVMLINLGSAAEPTPKAVRAFLREFLLDKRVVDVPAFLRYLLVYIFILPLRPRSIAPLYRSIWLPQGSPLAVHSEGLVNAVKKYLPETVEVALAMRYGEPSIASALDQLYQQGCDEIRFLPLFPQYAESTTGSVIAKVFAEVSKRSNMLPVKYLGDFYCHDFFINALAKLYKPLLADFKTDMLLLSYHGLPVRHIARIETKSPCVETEACPNINHVNRYCYRAQCFATSEALAKTMWLESGQYQSVFQSQFGKAKWIGPNVINVLDELIASGVKRLAVACPSFTADCLETLEEIGVELKQTWLSKGGEAFLLLPCLNDDDFFARGLAKWLLEQS